MVVAAILMIITNKANRWYEDYLADKISVYEPTFLMLDRSLTFREKIEWNRAHAAWHGT